MRLQHDKYKFVYWSVCYYYARLTDQNTITVFFQEMFSFYASLEASGQLYECAHRLQRAKSKKCRVLHTVSEVGLDLHQD